MIRVILDTNLWISYLISKRLDWLDRLFEEDELVLLFSEELLAEFITVTRRPKFEPHFSENDVDQLLGLFESFGEIINVVTEVKICRDPKDNFLLALAKDGAADYLVTGDGDLLEIEKFGATNILSISDFQRILRS